MTSGIIVQKLQEYGWVKGLMVEVPPGSIAYHVEDQCILTPTEAAMRSSGRSCADTVLYPPERNEQTEERDNVADMIMLKWNHKVIRTLNENPYLVAIQEGL